MEFGEWTILSFVNRRLVSREFGVGFSCCRDWRLEHAPLRCRRVVTSICRDNSLRMNLVHSWGFIRNDAAGRDLLGLDCYLGSKICTDRLVIRSIREIVSTRNLRRSVTLR